MKNLGTKIRKIRELKDFTQEHMASQMGLSQTAYSKIERGEVDISFSYIQRIAEILDVDLLQLLTFDTSMVVQKVSESQQGGHASGFTFHYGLHEKERDLYERKIQHLIEEIHFLRNLVGKQKE